MRSEKEFDIYFCGGVIMKGKMNVLTMIGFFIYIAYLLINKFLFKIPYEVAIPVVILGVALIVIGTIITNKR